MAPQTADASSEFERSEQPDQVQQLARSLTVASDTSTYMEKGSETEHGEATSDSKPTDVVLNSRSVVETRQRPILSHPTPSRPNVSYLDRFGNRVPPAQVLDSKYGFILQWLEEIESGGHSQGHSDAQLPTSSDCEVPHKPASAELNAQPEREGISVNPSAAVGSSTANTKGSPSDWAACQQVFLEANRNLLQNIHTTSAAFVLMPSYMAQVTGHEDWDVTSPAGPTEGQVTDGGEPRELGQGAVGCEGVEEQVDENPQASDAAQHST
jgi:hypothetical protein